MPTGDRGAGRVPVVIIGAGPAGVATAAELSRRGIGYRLLERGALGETWVNLYDSLRLHTGKHMSSLPRMGFDDAVPLFPSRSDFVTYLGQYADRFGLQVETRTAVREVTRDGDGWSVRTDRETIPADAVVVASGIVANPRIPEIPGREQFAGRVMHSVEYRRPDAFRGRRVLIIGVGNSGGEIGTELADAGAQVTVAVRSGANVVPRQLLGIPIQYWSYLIRGLPRFMRQGLASSMAVMAKVRRGPPVLPRPAHGPLDAIPLIGFHFVDAIRAGRITVAPAIDRFTARGVRFVDGSSADFDDVILATGYAAAIGFLGDLVTVDAKGFARRRDRVTSTEQDGLFFVGHNYDATGGLFNIRRDARIVAEALSRRTAARRGATA